MKLFMVLVVGLGAATLVTTTAQQHQRGAKDDVGQPVKTSKQQMALTKKLAVLRQQSKGQVSQNGKQVDASGNAGLLAARKPPLAEAKRTPPGTQLQPETHENRKLEPTAVESDHETASDDFQQTPPPAPNKAQQTPPPPNKPQQTPPPPPSKPQPTPPPPNKPQQIPPPPNKPQQTPPPPPSKPQPTPPPPNKPQQTPPPPNKPQQIPPPPNKPQQTPPPPPSKPQQTPPPPKQPQQTPPLPNKPQQTSPPPPNKPQPEAVQETNPKSKPRPQTSLKPKEKTASESPQRSKQNLAENVMQKHANKAKQKPIQKNNHKLAGRTEQNPATKTIPKPANKSGVEKAEHAKQRPAPNIKVPPVALVPRSSSAPQISPGAGAKVEDEPQISPGAEAKVEDESQISPGAKVKEGPSRQRDILHPTPTTYYQEQAKMAEPTSRWDVSTHTKVGLVSLAIITLAITATIIGVWYRKISLYHQRYGGHILLANDDEEFGIFNRHIYNSPDLDTYDSWKDHSY